MAGINNTIKAVYIFLLKDIIKVWPNNGSFEVASFINFLKKYNSDKEVAKWLKEWEWD